LLSIGRNIDEAEAINKNGRAAGKPPHVLLEYPSRGQSDGPSSHGNPDACFGRLSLRLGKIEGFPSMVQLVTTILR
jgi:hypothetical protein